MKTIQVYDKPMCCSTGVCGPQVDPVLPRFAADLAWLKSQGHQVERFNLAQHDGLFGFVERIEPDDQHAEQSFDGHAAAFTDGVELGLGLVRQLNADDVLSFARLCLAYAHAHPLSQLARSAHYAVLWVRNKVYARSTTTGLFDY